MCYISVTLLGLFNVLIVFFLLLLGRALFFFFFFFNDTATTEIYTLSLHDALPISRRRPLGRWQGAERLRVRHGRHRRRSRSEEHTSELQSPCNLVCRLLLEKKKKNSKNINY